MRYRDKLEIIRDILEAANGRAVTKTKIMYGAALSYNQLQEHLMFIGKRDLLCYDKEAQSFKTTEKGIEFLQLYNKIGEIVRKLPSL